MKKLYGGEKWLRVRDAKYRAGTISVHVPPDVTALLLGGVELITVLLSGRDTEADVGGEMVVETAFDDTLPLGGTAATRVIHRWISFKLGESFIGRDTDEMPQSATMAFVVSMVFL